MLLHYFFGQDSKRSQIVLHGLQVGMNDLPVIGGCRIIRGRRLFGGAAPRAGIEQGLSQSRSHRPERARPREELSDGRRLKPGGSAKSPIEIIRGLCHSDVRVRSRY